MNEDKNILFAGLLMRLPAAVAVMKGSGEYPAINGTVKLYGTAYGTLVATELTGLPEASGPCSSPIHALHIHEGGACTGNAADPFADAKTHYNPRGCPHPYHAGDLPPVFTSGGRAYAVTLTDRFTVEEVLGKTVILHEGLDDFTSQPSGNAGKKIACGEIRRVRR